MFSLPSQKKTKSIKEKPAFMQVVMHLLFSMPNSSCQTDDFMSVILVTHTSNVRQTKHHPDIFGPILIGFLRGGDDSPINLP